VGQVASKQLRNQAIAVTIAALIGMLLLSPFDSNGLMARLR